MNSSYTYIFDPAQQLWFQVTAVVDPENNVTLQTAQSGVPTPPPYIPVAGQSLISVEAYMVIFELTTLNYSTWTLASLAISDGIERYCNHFFRANAEAVPEGLQLIAANAIREQLDMNVGKLTALKKSESVRNYSYTLSDAYKPGSVLLAYYEALNLYKIRSFGFFALSGDSF